MRPINIQGNEYFTPNNEELNSITFNFLSENEGYYSFRTNACQEIEIGGWIIDSNLFLSSSAEMGSECTQDENITFQSYYLSSFWHAGLLRDEFEYNYQIIPENDYLKLIITSNESFVAYYTNQNLSLTEEQNKDLCQATFDNEYLIISSENLQIKEIWIFDSTGKEVFYSKNALNMYVGNLPNGIYFVEFRDEKGKIFSKKLIKP